MIHLQSQQELVRILQVQLQQEQERLEDMSNADTKISALTGELAPILEKYPVYRADVAEQLGLILPTLPSPTLRVIEIVDGDYRKDEQKNVVSDTKPSKYTESSNCLDDNSLDNQTELPATENASKDVDVTWYNSISGEVSAGNERRYFRVLWNNKQNQHQVGLKKSESAKRWSKDINPTTQPLIDRVEKEFKLGKPAENFRQKLYEAAEEVGGKFTASLCNLGTSGTFHLNETFGVFQIENEDIEVGHNDGNFWYIRPGRNKVYCSGDLLAFAEILKGIKTDIVLAEQKSKDSITPQLKAAENTQIDTAEIVDVATVPTVTWYNSSTGEVKKGSFKRYFRIIPDDIKDEHEIKFKQKTNSGNWIQPDNSTKLFAEAIWEEFKAGKPDAVEAILQRLYNVPEKVGGKFVKSHSSCTVGKLGTSYIPNQESIEVGYNDGSYWYFRPGYEKVYYSGDVHEFAEILTGLVKKEPPISNSSKIETAKPKSSDCWYTPPEIVELVELVLGKIDLDPCSDDGKHIPAKYHKTIREDGLACVWFGKVFINPPYSCPGKWIEKLISEVNDSNVTEAIALLPASTDTKWFKPLWNQPICFWKGRIKFLDVNYQPKLPARQSHCLVYWGENIEKFRQVFSQFGEVKLPTKNESTQVEVEVDPKEVEKTLTLTERITPLLLENWVIKTIDNNQIFIYSSDTQNSSNWVKVTDISHTEHGKTFPFLVSHETRFINDVKTIEEAIERATWWFDCPIIDNLELLMDTINSYDTDLLKITREENSNTAHILSGENQLGTIFLKSNDTLEIPEREYHLLEDLYSIDIGTLIEDIEKQKLGNYRDYLTGVSSLEQELNHLDTLQNALHCLSNHLNFIVIRQGEIFKAYNGKEWLENYLGSVKVNDLEIKPDEELINNLLEQYSFLLNQLTIDIIKGEQSIEIENYIITSEPIKELLIKETWNEQDLETANNLLNKLVESTPPWNELTETIRHKHQKIFEKDPEQTDDNDTNNGGSITPTPSPKNPNNNGSQTIESTKEELDTLFSAIQSYQTDLNIQKNNNKLTFYQQKYRLGSVELNPNKLVAEEGLIANLKISYGIDIKGLIESIEFASLDNCFELDPFEHIGKSNPAIFIPGCVVAPTWKEGRGLQGVLQLVNGQVATIQWLNSLDHGDNVPEQVNIGLLRYIAAQQTAKNDSLHTEALSDEPTAENFAALKFGGLIAATTVNNTNTNKENSEVVENTTASSFPDDNEDLIWEDLTWMDAIKVKLEKLEGFTVSHDEVDLTAWHYGTKVGSIHHNEENELEIEQKLIGELAKYNFDLEAFLVNLNIPYKFYHLKPVVITPTTERSDLQTSEQESSSEQKMTKKPPVEELNYQVNGKSISFGLTLPQLLSEQKTVTRRMWKDSYAKRFLNDWNARPGEFLYPALTKSYRVGGKQVGYIKLTHQPYQEKLADIPTSDLAAEGFPELSRAEFINKFFDGNDQQIAWVIRFDFIPNKEKPENNAEQIGENSPLPLDLLDQMTAVFDGLESIRTSRSGNVLWFYRGSENLYPCSMKTFDDNTSTLFPTVKLNDKMKELYGIDIDRVCYDLETGKEVNINNYIDHSVLEQTIKDSHKNNDTITWQDLLNNAAYLDITDSQTSDELNTSTTTEQSQTNTEEHPERLHWLKDTSMFNRSETYIVWNGTQKCGKINLCNKSKNKAGFGKWYVSPNVFGPYYDTIEKAATACWQDFISQNAEQTATQEDLIPF